MMLVKEEVERREEILAQRRAQHRSQWMRFLRQPLEDLKSHLLRSGGRYAKPPLNLDDVLETIRSAWPPEKDSSLESDCIMSPGGQPSPDGDWKQEALFQDGSPSSAICFVDSRRNFPCPPLLRRRYSVPEAVIRRCSLERSDSNQSDDMSLSETHSYTLPHVEQKRRKQWYIRDNNQLQFNSVAKASPTLSSSTFSASSLVREYQSKKSTCLEDGRTDYFLGKPNAFPVPERRQDLPIPRFSALPRSVSMLVNTSADCTSSEEQNNDDDSESLSLVDSLEDFPVRKRAMKRSDPVEIANVINNLIEEASRLSHSNATDGDAESPTDKPVQIKHDDKPVRGDIVIPDKPATKPAVPPPGKAFFVSMTDDAEEKEEAVPRPTMPSRLKEKLTQRHKEIEQKRHMLQRSPVPTPQTSPKKVNSCPSVPKRTTELSPKRNLGKRFQRFECIPEEKSMESQDEKVLEKRRLAQSNKKQRKAPSKQSHINTQRNHRKKSNNADGSQSKSSVSTTGSERDIPPKDTSRSVVGTGCPIVTSRIKVRSKSKEVKTKTNKAIAKQSSKGSKPEKCSGKTPVDSSGKVETVKDVPKSETLSNHKTEEPSEDQRTEATNETSPDIPTEITNEKTAEQTEKIEVGSENSSDQKTETGSDKSPTRSLSKRSFKGKDAVEANSNKGLLSLSKGWLNFYLLKESATDSQLEETSGVVTDDNTCTSSKISTDIKNGTQQKTVTVVDNENAELPRQYTIQVKTPVTETSSSPALSTSDEIHRVPRSLPQLKQPGAQEKRQLISVENLPGSYTSTSETGPSEKNFSTVRCTCRHGHKPVLEFLLPDCLQAELHQFKILRNQLLHQQARKSKHHQKRMSEFRSPSLSQESFESHESDSSDYSKSPNHRRQMEEIRDDMVEDHNFGLPVLADMAMGSGELGGSESSDPAPSYPVVVPRQHKKRGYRQRWRDQHHSPAWTVTIAGNCPQPELEMKLTFPGKKTTTSQSDSGLGEENGEKSKHFLPPAEPSASRLSVTLKNQQEGGSEKAKEIQPKSGKRTYQCLPDLQYHPGQNMNPKKAIKERETSLPVTSLNSKEDIRKMSPKKEIHSIWPKVHDLIKNNKLVKKSGRKCPEDIESIARLIQEGDALLSVSGSAITPRNKPRCPTMSEKDVTRNLSARIRSSFKS